MTPEKLEATIASVARAVVTDPRWRTNNDDLGVSVLGMLLYGYALGVGRLVMMLDTTDIDQAVTNVVMTHVGSAEKWTTGLLAEASRAAFDKSYHPTYFQLIGAGHQYFTANPDLETIVTNVFANVGSVRARSAPRPR